MIRLSTVRDLAVTATGATVLALAVADSLRNGPTPYRQRATPLPPTRHGWLFAADGYSPRARRLRPATAAEAAASRTSRAAGDGGWFGLTAAGAVVGTGDPAFARAGRTYGEPDRIDVVFVAGGGEDHAGPVWETLAGLFDAANPGTTVWVTDCADGDAFGWLAAVLAGATAAHPGGDSQQTPGPRP